jgi:hypothetical protein
MRPMASTWVASMQNIAAPDSASELMCVKCQSLASPFTAEYWHIGATMMRLGSFSPRSWIGENRALMSDIPAGGKNIRLLCNQTLPSAQPAAAATLPYCLIPAALISSRLAAVSRLTRSSISPGVIGIGSIPSFFRLSCVAGSPSTFNPAA